MPNYAALQKHKNQLIRKGLGGSLFLAPSTAVTLPEAFTSDTGDLVALPVGWLDGGLMTDDGMQFARNVDLSEVTSFGETAPTRSDVTSDVETVEVAFQETSQLTIAMFTGASLASLVADATTGELNIVKPDRPAPRLWRVFALAVDENAAGEIYVGRYFPQAKVTDYADQAYAKGDDPITWGCTLQAEKDPALGYAVRYVFGGPGWISLLVDMGFVAVTP